MSALMKLGKRTVKHDHRTLKLAKYVKALPPPPASAYFQQKVSDWGMMLNDQLGDCVPATMGHMVKQWTAYAGTEVDLTDDQILKAYEQIGGYVPGDPLTDNGCFMLDALNVWRKTGIAGHKINAFVAINPKDPVEVMHAIALFGNAFIGLQMPFTAQLQTGWHIDDTQEFSAEPGSWGGHSVPLVGYHDVSLTCVTWGAILNMSWNFLHRYCDEAYAVFSIDWLNQVGAPNGFDAAQLAADLQEITA